MRRFSELLLMLAFSILSPATLFTQCVDPTISFSHVQGTIVDSSGEPIPDVDLTLTSEGKAIASTATDQAGRFSIPAPPGKYGLRANRSGFITGFVRLNVGADLVQVLRPKHFWMILEVATRMDQCTETITSRRQFEERFNKKKQSP
jgi:Carboxypeptidase regulatory-like domain